MYPGATLCEILKDIAAMISLVAAKQAELHALCARYRVRRLALFGSALCEDYFAADSDLDFAVEFEPLTPREHKECYFGLLAAIEELFRRPIDLVEYAPITNPYFLQALLESEETLYEVA
ncbi:MAG: nucleotidyltransferase domain-containing protein [Chloroflexota bacterium]